MPNLTPQTTVMTTALLPQNLINQMNNIIRPWWTTKNLLIIRSELPNDGFTGYSFVAAETVKSAAIAAGWTVTDLQKNDTNRTNVNNTINNGAFDLILCTMIMAATTLCTDKTTIRLRL